MPTTVCFWLFMLGISHFSLLFILPPPIFMPITQIPLAFFGEVLATFLVIPLHIFIVIKLIRLNQTEKSNVLSIDTWNLSLFCAAILLNAYGCGYHNVIAPTDLLINFGQTTKTMSYGGYFAHNFHEYVAHKIQYSGTFLFYILILNLIQAKLSLIKSNKNNDDSKYSKVIKQFLDIEFNAFHAGMASFHGLALGALFAALDMFIVIVIFCPYIIYRCIYYKSAAHRYMLIMSILMIIMFYTQLYIIKPLGISTLSDEGRQFWWELRGMKPQWSNWSNTHI